MKTLDEHEVVCFKKKNIDFNIVLKLNWISFYSFAEQNKKEKSEKLIISIFFILYRCLQLRCRSWKVKKFF